VHPLHCLTDQRSQTIPQSQLGSQEPDRGGEGRPAEALGCAEAAGVADAGAAVAAGAGAAGVAGAEAAGVAGAAAQDDGVAFPTSFDGSDAVDYPPSFEAAEASAAPYPAQADTALYSPFNVPRASAVPHAASFTAAHADAAAYPAYFDTAQDADFYYTPSSDVPQATAAPRVADAPFYPPYDVAQPSAASYPPSFHDRAVPYPTTFADNQAYLADARAKADIFSVQDNPTADDDYVILEDEKMVLTGSDEQVNLVAEETDKTPTTPKTMIVDEGKDVEMMESRSLSARPREAWNLRDGDIEMQ